jgi:hypothetical protein
MILYHGSPYLFDHFESSKAGDATGLKYGFGVYLTEIEATAVHYSQPRKLDFTEKHYLYTVEIPDFGEGEFLVSAKPVSGSIIVKAEQKLGVEVPESVKAKGKEFRKWFGKALAGTGSSQFEQERQAAEVLESLDVHYNVWPQSQSNPEGPKNIAVFDPARVRIVKREEIDIEYKQSARKWVLAGRKEI